MAREQKLELKVGIFVLLGLIVLFVLVFLISDLSFLNPNLQLKIIFEFANGIKIASPVRLAGIDAGTVKNTRIFYDPASAKTKVELSVWLKSRLKIPKDSQVWINTLGLLGEKYVEIIPGKDYSGFLKNGDTIVGEDPISMQEITTLGRKIALKLEDSIEEFNGIIKDADTKESIKEILANLSSITQKINEGQGTLGKLVNDDKVYKDLELLVDDLKKNPWKLIHRK